MTSEAKIRIAWFSPLSESSKHAEGSAAAYFSDMVLSRLPENFEIDCFVQEQGAAFGENPYSFLTALQRHQDIPYSFFLYHVEDHPASSFARKHMGLVPGVSYFHDVFFRPECWNSELRRVHQISKQKIFKSEFGKGDSSEDAFCDFERNVTLLPIFPCERNLEEYRRRGDSTWADAKAFVASPNLIPYPIEDRGQSCGGATATSSQKKIIAFSGTVNIEDRAHCLLSALGRLSLDYELHWLIAESEKDQSLFLCKEFDVTSVRFQHGRSVKKWQELVSSADIAVHTLFSGYGDPDPCLQVSLMAGVPCIVSDFSAPATLPQNVVCKIPPGEGEVENLLHTITRLLSDEKEKLQERDLLSSAGRAYAIENSRADFVVQELAATLSRYSPRLSKFTSAWIAEHLQSLIKLQAELS